MVKYRPPKGIYFNSNFRRPALKSRIGIFQPSLSFSRWAGQEIRNYCSWPEKISLFLYGFWFAG